MVSTSLKSQRHFLMHISTIGRNLYRRFILQHLLLLMKALGIGEINKTVKNVYEKKKKMDKDTE